MDRNTSLAMVLIFGLIVAWMYMTMPTAEQLAEKQRRQRALTADTLRPTTQKSEPQIVSTSERDSRSGESESLGMFASTWADTLLTRVETPFYTAIFSNVGAGPVAVEFKRYKTWSGKAVQMVTDTTRSAYSLGFISTENLNVELRNAVFKPVGLSRELFVEGRPQSLVYELPVIDGLIRYTYTIIPEAYHFELAIDFVGSAKYIASRKVEFGWKPALSYSEKSHVQEGKVSAAVALSGGELEKLTLLEAGNKETPITGSVKWVATKTQFFTQIVKSVQPTDGAVLTAFVNGDINSELTKHTYNASLRNVIGDDNRLEYKMYVGPLRYRMMDDYDATTYEMVDLGWSIFRWFSEPLAKYVFVYYFDVIAPYMGNFGLAVIMLGVLLKLALWPLTKKSFESMAAMRELQPELQAIQEKYASDPQKQQEAVMKLYKTAKVNPLGGCLPNLLQMPILVTLWAYFQSSMEIRQKSFLWVSDLSAPDFIINLPFEIPFIGSGIGGFCLLMVASMVVQMRISGQSGPANPQMKMMQYFMPGMMFFIFNSFSSGLNLYYFTYNVLSIAHQYSINVKNIDHTKLMESVDKKKAKEIKKSSGKKP